MLTIIINIALLLYVLGLVIYAKKKGSLRRPSQSIFYLGLAPPAVVLTVVFAVKGEWSLFAIMLLMPFAALASWIQVKARKRDDERAKGDLEG